MTQSRTVLLVEDNPGDERLIREFATSHPTFTCEVRSCATVKRALELLAEAPYDAILLDLSLPDSRGLDTVRAIVAQVPETPVIVLTGTTDIALAKRALHLGVDDYVDKGELSAELLCRSIAYAVERGAHRQAIAHSNDRFWELAEMLPEVVFECDLEGNLTFVNAIGMQKFGYTQQLFERGLNAFDMIAVEDRDCAREGFAHALQGTAERGTQYQALRRDGTTFPVTIHSTAILKDGKPVGLRGIIVDVTRRVEARRALETADQIVSAIPSGLLIYRFEPPDQLVLVSGNPASKAIVDAGQYVGTRIEEHWPAAMIERMKPDLLPLLENGRSYDQEAVIYPRGALRAFRMRAFPIGGDRLVLAFENITERKLAEEELQLKNEAFEGALAAHSITDADGNLTHVNARFLEFWGYASKQDVIGRPYTDFITSTENLSSILDLLGDRGTWQGTCQAQRADGTTFPCESLATGIRDDSGRFVATQATHFDITERLEQQRILQQSESRHRQLFESAAVGIGYFTIDGDLLAVNPEAASRMGSTPQELVGKNVREFSARAEVTLDRLAEAAASKESIRYEDEAMRDGELQCVIRTYTALRNTDGTVIGVQLVASDISDIRRAERALAASEERSRAILDTMPDLLFWLDDEGRFLDVHGPEEALFLPPDEFLGKRFAEVLPADAVATMRVAFEALLSSGEMQTAEYALELPSGTRSFEARLARVGDEGILAIIRDISERKQASEALEMADHILRLSPVGMAIYRYEPPATFRLVDGNEESERLTGIHLDADRGRRLADLWPQADELGVRKMCLDVVRTGAVYHAKMVDYQRDRVAGKFRVRAFRIPQDRVVITFEDVSEQNEAQEQLRVSEERYRSIVLSSPVGILTVDSTGRVATCNPALLKMNGVSEEDIIGAHFTKLPTAHLRDLPKYIRIFRSIVAGADPKAFEASWTTPDGAEHHGEVHAKIIRGGTKRWSVHVTVLDITERMKAVRALEESEARYRSLFENAALGIYRTTPDGRILAANAALLRMLGYDSFEHLAERNLEKGLWYEPETPRSQFRALVEENDSLSGLESAWKRRDGTTIHVREHARAIRDRKGDVICYEGTLEDITETRQMQHTLELTQFSVDSSRVMILWVDAAGGIVYANRAAADMLGYDPEALLGMHVWDIQRDYPRERRSRLWQQLKEGEPASETVFSRRDGTTYPVELSAQYISFRGDEYEFVVATDITDRKTAEAALRESEENYRTIFDSANDAIMLHDAVTGRFLDVNSRTEEMFGYPRDTLLDFTVGDLSLGASPYSDDEALELIHAAASDRPQIFEWHCRHKSGRLFWSEVNLRTVTLLGRNVVLAVARDITERKELEAKLWQSQRLESIGTLASGVAHEINNPLMGMINYAELISSRSEDDALSRFAEEIKVEGNRVAKIVRNLLSFARQDREQHSPARLRDIVDASLSIIGSLLRKDFVLIDLQVPEDLPIVRCRSQQIQQILINLLTNARDSLDARFPAADERKILRVTAEVLEDDEGRWLRTVVEDTGVGIPEQVIDRIFDPFFTTKGRDKGTGLGLSISYGIACDHGGRLSVESTPNEWTRFLLDLPLSEDAGDSDDHDV